ncbi:MAG: zinc-binding dehydrogenase, partial [Candidatus Thorarchaeota archaeon]
IRQVALSKSLELIAIDGSNYKLQLAKEFGAHHIINRLKQKDITNEIKKLTNNLGADIVVDASGNPEALKDIITSCKTRGKIHIKSTHGIETPINLTNIVVRELTLYSSRCGPFDKAIKGLKSGKIRVDKLISKKYGLKDIEEAVAYYSRDQDHIKSIIHI